MQCKELKMSYLSNEFSLNKKGVKPHSIPQKKGSHKFKI